MPTPDVIVGGAISQGKKKSCRVVGRGSQMSIKMKNQQIMRLSMYLFIIDMTRCFQGIKSEKFIFFLLNFYLNFI